MDKCAGSEYKNCSSWLPVPHDRGVTLVLHYSEEEGAGAAAAFLCTTNRGKLLQHKLIHVQCTKKSARIPVSPVQQYGYSVLKRYLELIFSII